MLRFAKAKMDITLAEINLLLPVFFQNEHGILREVAGYFTCMFHTERCDCLQKVSNVL